MLDPVDGIASLCLAPVIDTLCSCVRPTKVADVIGVLPSDPSTTSSDAKQKAETHTARAILWAESHRRCGHAR